MSDQATQNPEPEMTEEEAKRQLAEARAHLEKQVSKAKQLFSKNIKLADDRLKHAIKQLEETAAMRAQVAEHQDLPGGRFHLTNMDLLCRVYESTKTMMEIEKSSNQRALAIVESEDLPENPVFPVPDHNPLYVEARSRIDYNLGVFLWVSNVEGIDVVLRTAAGVKAAESQSPEEEAWREGNIAELKAAMAADQELARFVGMVAAELQETQALIEWAAGNLKTVLQLPVEAKRSYLEDNDWAKLNAKVVYLCDLADRAQAYPVLAKHFPQPETVPLPYEQIQWSEPAGTGRLGTGRLQGQTGRLSQTGTGQTGRLPRQ